MNLWSFNGNHDVDRSNEPEPPKLTRDACLSQKGMRSFLKLSRLASDDTIKQHLNNILDGHEYVPSRRSNTDLCRSFIDGYLFAHWDSRLKTIEFCEAEAQQLKAEIDKTVIKKDVKDVDPRIDSYYVRSTEDEAAAQYFEFNQLTNWVQNENEIEKIVQDRSIEVLGDRCNVQDDLRKKFEAFRRN